MYRSIGYYTLIWALLVGGLYGCANRQSIDGGPRDTRPPRIVADKSTPSGQTDWREREIVLTFDEFVNQQIAADQIIVSPPLKYPLRASALGKRVVLRIDDRDTLAPNTTYAIQLGSAVKDLTEGNPASDISFVCSTGSTIDSAEVLVQVRDYNTQDVLPDIWVLAYTSDSDTVLRAGRPSYIAKTDSSGTAILKNMPQIDVQVYALKDGNRNYRFDDESELIGYLDHRVTAVVDADTVHFIYLFEDQKSLQVTDAKAIDSTAILLVGNEMLSIGNYIGIDTLDGTADTLSPYFIKKDTLILPTSRRYDLLVMSTGYGRTDSLALSRSTIDLHAMFDQPSLIGARSIPRSDTLYQRLIWAGPVDGIDTTAIYRWDSAANDYVPLHEANYAVDVLADKTVVDMLWPVSGSIDTLRLDSGAFYSAYGATDALVLPIQMIEPERLSRLLLTLTELDATQQYLIELITSDGEVMRSEKITGHDEALLDVPSLPPVKYELQIVTDLNKNGRWDAARFDDRSPPEPRQTEAISRLRANWDVEQVVRVLDR